MTGFLWPSDEGRLSWLAMTGFLEPSEGALVLAGDDLFS
jgi:hypothetical protein